MLSPDGFRRIALGMAGAIERAHMGHPDFRANGRIFATLYPDGEWGMVKLTPDQQQTIVQAHPATFAPASGAWGRQGSTKVRLDTVDAATVRAAMRLAWQNTDKHATASSRPAAPALGRGGTPAGPAGRWPRARRGPARPRQR
jgi:hypothetical protein